MRDVVNNAGNVIDRINYDAFGNILSSVNPSASNAATALATRFLFTGQEWDADAHLYYYNARWYDPATGTFISKDPLGFDAGDMNLYRYVGNSPTNAVDPNGLAKRFPDGNTTLGNGGEFQQRWRFELDRTYDFDVTVVQRIQVRIRNVWDCGTGEHVSTNSMISYFEVVGRVPAGSRSVEFNGKRSIDTWSVSENNLRINGGAFGSRATEGSITMEGQIRAFKSSEIEEELKAFKPNQGYDRAKDANALEWTAGAFPSNNEASFWKKGVVEYENGSDRAFWQLTVEWGCNGSTVLINGTPKAIKPNRRSTWFQ